MYEYFDWRYNITKVFDTDDELGAFQMKDYKSTICIPDSEIDDFKCHFSELPSYHPYWRRISDDQIKDRLSRLEEKLTELRSYLKPECSPSLQKEIDNIEEQYNYALNSWNEIINKRKVKQVHWSADQS